jgi:hypothetical protein
LSSSWIRPRRKSFGSFASSDGIQNEITDKREKME